ncbi:hypothetical protein RhiLY_02218 [Ceratobasidium sp. AG-Ba]|nr:hypothetical protein RhiLY_02218 [Ceratobasidium sp. AG-Ba]
MHSSAHLSCTQLVPSAPTTPAPAPPVHAPISKSPKSRFVYDSKRHVYVELFPDERAGAPINDEFGQAPDLTAYMAAVGSLSNPDYFETAELLMTTGLTNTGRDEHLKSRLYIGRTPWINNKQLFRDIDRLPHGPGWNILDINLNEESQRLSRKHSSYLFKRSVIATFRDLMANPEFKNHMKYAPRREWTAEDRTCRVYGETCSGDWWWDLQEKLPDKYAMLVPLIASYDKTVMSVISGGQVVHPLYLTLGNIDKSIRRQLSTHATALLAYLPVDAFTQVSDDLERSRLRRDLTQRALEKVFEELLVASKEGLVVLCPDGRYRRAYPVLAGAMLDYEEQGPMAGVKRYRCPKCLTPKGGWDNGNIGLPRTNADTLEALHAWLSGEGREKADRLELREKPVWPWWANIPHMDFAGCIMPDFLHQLHQGMVRHLLNWTAHAGGSTTIDRLFILMPEAEGMRHFGQGITSLDGDEWDLDFVRLTRALLDFVYRAQASRMTDDDIGRLDEALADVHKYKAVLVRMEIFNDNSRRGTPDGFSTEGPEHMHIESKQAWRASNKTTPSSDERSPRTTACGKKAERAVWSTAKTKNSSPNIRFRLGTWLRLMGAHGQDSQARLKASLVTWQARSMRDVTTRMKMGNSNIFEVGCARLRKQGNMWCIRTHVVDRPETYSWPSQGYRHCCQIWGNDLVSALHVYLTKLSARRYPSNFLPTIYHEFPVWHRLYLRHEAPWFDPEWPRRDVIRARPHSDDHDSAFDVALLIHDREKFGLHRYRAARVRAIFALPRGFEHFCSHPLVYVELFTPFSLSVSPHHSMHTLSHLRHFDGGRRSAVVSSLDLAAACHLAPQIKRLDPDLNLNTRLDMLSVSRYFYFNHYYNRYIYRLVDYWRASRASRSMAREYS